MIGQWKFSSFLYIGGPVINSDSARTDISHDRQLDGRSKSFSGRASRMASLIMTPQRMWLLPLLMALVLFLVGWWANRVVEDAVKKNLAGQLQALLDADVEALKIWLNSQRSAAMSLAGDSMVREAAKQLANVAKASGDDIRAPLLASPVQDQLRSELNPFLMKRSLDGFLVVDRDLVILGSDLEAIVGDRQLAKAHETMFQTIFSGKTMIVPPFASRFPLPDSEGVLRSEQPVMFVAAPIVQDDKVLAALCLRIRPDYEFSEITRVARAGKSGETYAFNRSGLMVTNSRFDEELKQIGLLLDREQMRSILNIQIRDPGVDLTLGKRSTVRRSEQPFTRMAESAVNGESGVDVEGYRDYRGVPVIGAWTWLSEYDLGVATELDVSEAYQPLAALRFAIWLLMSLLIAGALAIMGFGALVSRLEQRARRAVLEAKQLGQYSLGEKIASGGMGSVYHAHHELLERPTAVKLLDTDNTNESSIARFEHEVQMTCQLTHPNTIAIYDYGRTPEGVFYYAMEYLDGMSLQELIDRFGPLSDGRAIYILRQLCGSLAEAHAMGLLHRDIKPANIILTQRGGLHDFVKLIDFGLVKASQQRMDLTIPGTITGTPLYVSPEAIQQRDLDQRSDLYAVGAVGYFLITGKPVFESTTLVDLCQHHVRIDPTPPSKRAGRSVDSVLETCLLKCLSKSPDDRPESASELRDALGESPASEAWSETAARQWWAEHDENDSTASSTDSSTDTKRTSSDTMRAGMTQTRFIGPDESEQQLDDEVIE